MKKLLTIIIIAGMTTFFACGPSAKDKAEIEKKLLDSINTADSLKSVLRLDSLLKDSMDKAVESKLIEESSKTTDNSSTKTLTKNSVDCNTKHKVTGTLKEFKQPDAYSPGFQMRILSDENKEYWLSYMGTELKGEIIIIKQESSRGAADVVFNTKLLNKRYIFCFEGEDVATQIDLPYYLVSMKPL